MARSGLWQGKYTVERGQDLAVSPSVVGMVARIPIVFWLLACVLSLFFLVVLRYQVTAEHMMLDRLLKQHMQAQRHYVVLQVERDNVLNQGVLEQVAVNSQLLSAKDSRLKVLGLYG